MSDYGQSAEARVLAHRVGETHTLNQPYARNSGNFQGNATQNRAIAHGLGVAPKQVKIWRLAGANQMVFICQTGFTIGIYAASDSSGTATAPDSTNFYVGLDAAGAWGNENLVNYRWEATG